MSLTRDVTTVGSATLLSRLLGFFRDVGIAAILGAGAMSDAYFAALQIPNLFRRLLAEGALNAAFVPMWLRLREEQGPDAARRFGERAFGTMFLALGLIALLCVLFAPAVIHLIAPGFRSDGERYDLAVQFIRLSAPYIAIAALVAVAASILNAEGRVGAVSIGIVIFNAVLLSAVITVWITGDTSSHAGDILSFAIALAGLGQFIVIGFALARSPQRPRRISFRLSQEARRFYARAIPGVIAGGIPQLKLMAGAMVASSSPAAVSWLYYANRLYELPLGVVSIAIAAVLAPRIASSVLAGDREAIAASQSRALEIALALALPSAIAFATLATPIAGGLFERGKFGPNDTIAVASALAAISAGLPGHILEKVLAGISFAYEDTRTPMYAALAGLAVATTLALLLFPHYGHTGIAAAIAMSGWVGATTLTIILWRRGWLKISRDAWRRLPAIIFASAVMGIIILSGNTLISMNFAASSTAIGRIVVLAAMVTTGLVVYLGCLHVLGIARINELLAAVNDRRQASS
jgi:putative peptidoglycan lipid II flippase